jgi:hypothetical protein
MLFWTVFLAGMLLLAMGLVLRPKRAGAGWALDIGFGDRATRLERILFVTGAALALLALLVLR